MSEESMGPNNAESQVQPNKGRRRWLGYSLAGLMGLVLGGAAASHAEFGPGWCGSHGFGGHHWRRNADPAAIQEMVRFRVDWVLRQIDATDAQRDQIDTVFQEALSDLQPLMEQHRENRQAIFSALTGPDVDPAVTEVARLEGLKLLDSASGRLMRALEDGMQVLTPAQRTKLAERYRGLEGSAKI